MSEQKRETQNYNELYGSNYCMKDGALWKETVKKNGIVLEKLCNFAPYISREIIQDDGVETTARVALRGIHESGKELPEVEISAAALAAFNQEVKNAGIDRIIEENQRQLDAWLQEKGQNETAINSGE